MGTKRFLFSTDFNMFKTLLKCYVSKYILIAVKSVLKFSKNMILVFANTIKIL